MKKSDAFFMGLRSVRERPLEAGLVVIGLALAACIACSSLLLLGSQRAWMQRALNGPALREIVVKSGPGAASAMEHPVAETVQTGDRAPNLGDGVLADVKTQIPGIAAAYRWSMQSLHAGSERFQAGFGGGPGGGGGAPGGPGEGAPQGNTSTAGPSDTSSPSGPVTQAGLALGGSGGEGPDVDRVPEGQGPDGQAPDGKGGPGNPEGGPDTPAHKNQNARGNNTATVHKKAVATPTQTPENATPALVPAIDEFRSMTVSPSFFQAYGVSARSGSLFTDADTSDDTSSRSIVLGGRLAKLLFPAVSLASLPGNTVVLNRRTWTIMGVLDRSAENVSLSSGTELADLAYTPAIDMTIKAGGRVFHMGRFADSLRFAVADSKDLEMIAEAIKAHFIAIYGSDMVSVTVPSVQQRQEREALEGLLWLIAILGAGGMFMAYINLVNMMVVRSQRRKAATGILAAMGANHSDLVWLQGFEGAILTTVGTLVGIGLSLPLYHLLDSLVSRLFSGVGGMPADWTVLAFAIPLFLLLGIGMSLIPAFRTSRLDIAQTLRTE